MDVSNIAGPTAAERARSVLATAGSADVTWLDRATDGKVAPESWAAVHYVLPGGDHDGSPGRPVLIEVADAAPLPVPDRIRARVRLSGHALGRVSGTAVLQVRPRAVRRVYDDPAGRLLRRRA